MSLEQAPDPGDLPLFDDSEGEFNPEDYFFPGMGTPVALLSKNILMLDVSKQLYDNRLKLNIKTMMDQVFSGYLMEFSIEYDITELLKTTVSLNKIIGDKTQGEVYTFNNMESFSNFRCELQYSF